MMDLNAFGRNNGSGYTKSDAGNYKNNSPTSFTISCDRSGRGRASKSIGIRKVASAKTQCPWKAYASATTKSSGKWAIRLKEGYDTHNHPATMQASVHAVHRRLTEEEKKDIEAMSRNIALRPREIRRTLETKNPGLVIEDRDIHNYRALLRKQELGGYTPTQALVKLFEEENIMHRVRYEDDDPSQPVRALFWLYEECIEMWKRFPWALQMDNTYKTNRFSMPLFTFTAWTHLNSVVSIGFRLVDNEREDGFTWLVMQMESIRNELSIPPPAVVITDKEAALKNALKDKIPTAHQQICIFHINQNVILNTKKKYKKIPAAGEATPVNDEDEAVEAQPLSPTDEDLRFLNKHHSEEKLQEILDNPATTKQYFYLLWRVMVFTKSEREFNMAWRKIQEVFSGQKSLLGYLKKTYLPVKEQWAAHEICHQFNMGMRTSSPTEASHQDLKSHLGNGRSTVFQIHQAALQMCQRRTQLFHERTAKMHARVRALYASATWLGNLNTKLSHKAIDLMNTEKLYADKAMGPGGEEIGACNWRTCTFEAQYGLPCRHKILGKLLAKKNNTGGETTIQQRECHRFWYLQRDLVAEYPYATIKDPAVVTSTKGRPKGLGPFASSRPVPSRPVPSNANNTSSRRPTAESLRRVPSAFELADDDPELPAAGSRKRPFQASSAAPPAKRRGRQPKATAVTTTATAPAPRQRHARRCNEQTPPPIIPTAAEEARAASLSRTPALVTTGLSATGPIELSEDSEGEDEGGGGTTP
jgi:hypothetical protein